MIEGRGIISNIEDIKRKIESVGGVYRSDYSFKDIIFTSGKDSNDFLKVRIMSKKNWPTKDVRLIRKQFEFKNAGKIDRYLLKKEFDDKEAALGFIAKELPDFKPEFEYSRTGWEYELDGSSVFVEGIEFLGPSVEVEADSEEKLQALFDKMGIKELLKESIPEAVRRIIKK